MELYNSRSFTIAADRMFVSQSTFSKQIKALESELGVVLYDRENRELTGAGKEFLKFCNNVLKEYEILDDRLNQYRYIPRQKISVGVIPILGEFEISKTISKFQITHENVSVKIYEHDQEYIEDLFIKDKLDLVIIRSDFMDLSKFETVLIGTDELVFVCNKEHRLSKRKVLELRELEDEGMVLYDSTSVINKLIVQECQNYGFTPNVMHTSSRLEVIDAMISDGFGVSILPKNDVQNMNDTDIVSIKLSQPIISEVRLVKKIGDNSAPIEKMFSFFKERYM